MVYSRKSIFRNLLSIFGLSVIFFLSLISCSERIQKAHEGNFEPPDSLWAENLIAIIKEDGCTAVLMSSKDDQQLALKLNYYDSGQILLDSLQVLASGTFYSIRFTNTYHVKEKSIQVIHEEKIIHPSSNWQRKSPWKEVQRLEYPRVFNNYSEKALQLNLKVS